jgi:hypothetical protein
VRLNEHFGLGFLDELIARKVRGENASVGNLEQSIHRARLAELEAQLDQAFSEPALPEDWDRKPASVVMDWEDGPVVGRDVVIASRCDIENGEVKCLEFSGDMPLENDGLRHISRLAHLWLLGLHSAKVIVQPVYPDPPPPVRASRLLPRAKALR